MGLILLCAVLAACRQPGDEASAQDTARQDPLPACEWCGTTEAPKKLDWETRIAGPKEPGEPLVLSGTVYKADGATPAADVVLYLYHTNAQGIYPKRGDETGNGRRHGYLRAWLRTRADGRYRFTTIKPASYPNRREPAHIHAVVQPPGQPEDWIDSFIFADDPLVTAEVRARLRNKGGPGLVTLERDDKGVWRGQRKIVLEK
jgi:protocatechuate 3,4-dioxygenase beta subunit